MLESLIVILIVGLFCWIVYFLCGKLVSGTPLSIIGIVLAIIFVAYAVKRLDLLDGLSF